MSRHRGLDACAALLRDWAVGLGETEQRRCDRSARRGESPRP
ncbi:hypothetical protein [Streptomyces sp. HD]|nr:hypothetical protein [Streptomyces sp. HD]MDC0773555.1 hypothetical protein [Streptomyces sp. HD]